MELKSSLHATIIMIQVALYCLIQENTFNCNIAICSCKLSESDFRQCSYPYQALVSWLIWVTQKPHVGFTVPWSVLSPCYTVTFGFTDHAVTEWSVHLVAVAHQLDGVWDHFQAFSSDSVHMYSLHFCTIVKNVRNRWQTVWAYQYMQDNNASWSVLMRRPYSAWRDRDKLDEVNFQKCSSPNSMSILQATSRFLLSRQ